MEFTVPSAPQAIRDRVDQIQSICNHLAIETNTPNPAEVAALANDLARKADAKDEKLAEHILTTVVVLLHKMQAPAHE